MSPNSIIDELEYNAGVFKAQLTDVDEQIAVWKPAADKWCLIEVVCHLCDEEREDFRARVKSILEDPNQPLTPFNPLEWVTERDYMKQVLSERLNKFLKERSDSVFWLRHLMTPRWDNAYNHPKLGPITARQMLANWLAHDHIHIRQINRLKYEYLKFHCADDISYAGLW